MKIKIKKTKSLFQKKKPGISFEEIVYKAVRSVESKIFTDMVYGKNRK